MQTTRPDPTTGSGLVASALRALPWWLPPLLIVAVSRAVDIVALVVLAREQPALADGEGYFLHAPLPASPGYGDVATNWDGQWYRQIAEEGYPGELPRAFGEVQQNAYAFYPALPALARLGMLAGLDFGLAAGLVSLACSTLGLLMLYRMISEVGGGWVALLTVTGLTFAAPAPILTVAYTEGLALLGIVGALFALRRRRYGWYTVAVLLLALTRPIVVALAPVLAVHAWLRWRRGDLDVAGAWRLAGLTVMTGAAFALWPAVVALLSGELDAYLLTQQAWILTDEQGWPAWAGQLLGRDGVGPASKVAVLVLLGVALTLQPAARRWGAELQVWVLSYSAFLLVSARPTPSIVRYCLLLLVVWWPFPGLGRGWGPAARIALLAAIAAVGTLLQLAWLTEYYLITSQRLQYP